MFVLRDTRVHTCGPAVSRRYARHHSLWRNHTKERKEKTTNVNKRYINVSYISGLWGILQICNLWIILRKKM